MAIPNQGLMKRCTKCGIEKEVKDFYFSNRSRGFMTECKECTKIRTRARYSAKHEEILVQGKKYATEKRKRIRDAVFAAYGGYVCACCGETENKFLTIDHINNDGASKRKQIYKQGKGNTAGYHTYYWLARNQFPAGYQVLCMNCNYGKRMNNGVCPHKTRCNDYPQVGVGPSGPKRLVLVSNETGKDIVCPSEKSEAA